MFTLQNVDPALRISHSISGTQVDVSKSPARKMQVKDSQLEREQRREDDDGGCSDNHCLNAALRSIDTCKEILCFDQLHLG